MAIEKDRAEPLLRRDLIAAGMTDAEIRAAVRTGCFTRMGSGSYVNSGSYVAMHPDDQYRIG